MEIFAIMANGLDGHYLGVALKIAEKSTCLWKRFGAIIVKDNTIISSGYNSAPIGNKSCLDIGNCARSESAAKTGSRMELCRAVHAEVNAIIRTSPFDRNEATIYIAGFDVFSDKKCESFPCPICDKIIKNSGLKRVVY